MQSGTNDKYQYIWLCQTSYHSSDFEVLENPIALITQFLEEQTGNLQGESMILELKKAPKLNQEFKVKVVVELSTGEVFEVESELIVITP